MLPADSHVHSEWSWDALDGSMERTCARAIEIGLPVVAFTEHVDFTTWTVSVTEYDERFHPLIASDGSLSPPRMDLEGYFACIERCRDRYPDLRILTGVELGQPHWHADSVAPLLAAGRFDRILGSVHCLPIGGRVFEPNEAYKRRPPGDVLRDYLAEVPRLVAGSDVFAVLAHIDYAVRYWPREAAPFDPSAFQDEFRHALRALAASGRALEINTSIPLHPAIVRWWYEEGGEAVTFGSDAHAPRSLARRFTDTAAMVEAQGFRPGKHPYDFWIRTGGFH